jgi:teichuronic acid biosynthesis glycosyltransferase TuaG
LRSICLQQYNNYRIILIDDRSTDQSQHLINNFIKITNSSITCIINEKCYGAAYSRYQGIQYVDDDEIIIFLDGDDWLFSDNILEYLNTIYNNDIDITFGSYRKYNSKVVIMTNKVKDIDIKNPGRYHLRTGKASIWKKYAL